MVGPNALIKGPIVQHQCRNPKNTNYLQEKNKLQHVVMVPLLELGPFSNQWSQVDVLTLNGWDQYINERVHRRMGPTSVDISILCERLALGTKNDDTTFGIQYPIKFGPKSDHVFGSNDHVFGTNLRQSIRFGVNTVN